jgi:hypothetical protein
MNFLDKLFGKKQPQKSGDDVSPTKSSEYTCPHCGAELKNAGTTDIKELITTYSAFHPERLKDIELVCWKCSKHIKIIDLMEKTAPQSTEVPSDNQTTAEGTANLTVDKKFVFDIKAKDLKVLGLYSNDPRGYASFIKTDQKVTAVLKFFEYADSSFVENIKKFINSGTVVCDLFFDKLNEMNIEEANIKIKADLSQKGLLKGGESLILLNTGIADTHNMASFIMLIGVIVVADNKSAVNVVSADNIQESRVKLNLRP